MCCLMDRSKDWLAQAEYDLYTAKQLTNTGSFAWSCFVSQQAAEKAIKAILEMFGLPIWGHDLLDLLSSLEEKTSIPEEVRSSCHRLNLYYVATRYPDVFPSGAPASKFSKEQSMLANSDAKVVINFARTIIYQ